MTTGAASGLTVTGATLNGTVNPNGAATRYQFEYGTTTSYGSTSPTPAGDAGSGTSDQSMSTNLTGLQPSTTYHYRLNATNAAGTTHGGDQAFQTNASSSTLGISVSGNHFVDGSGHTVQLRGANRSGTQYACSEGWGIFDGPRDSASLDAMKA